MGMESCSDLVLGRWVDSRLQILEVLQPSDLCTNEGKSRIKCV